MGLRLASYSQVGSKQHRSRCLDGDSPSTLSTGSRDCPGAGGRFGRRCKYRSSSRTRVTIGARCRRLDLNHPFLPRYSRPPRLHCSPSLMLPPTPHGSGTLHRAAHADLQRNFSLCIRIVWMSLLAVIAYCVCLRHAFVPDAYHLFSPSLLWVDCRPCL